MDNLDGNFVPPAKEPMFNIPWPAMTLLAVLALAFELQSTVLSPEAAAALALSPAGLAGGAYGSLVSYMFLHSGWAHVLMNGASALAFGPPVARFLGVRGRGPVLFFAFFLASGVAAGLGYCLLHWNSPAYVIGASGAVSGLWGAASRLLIGQGRLAPVLNRQVLLQGAAFVIVNTVVGLGGAFALLNIAWEAHLIGYAFGLLTIGVLARARATPGTTD